MVQYDETGELIASLAGVMSLDRFHVCKDVHVHKEKQEFEEALN